MRPGVSILILSLLHVQPSELSVSSYTWSERSALLIPAIIQVDLIRIW
jgi:hypothetical protein